jgi:hypothetical protein
MTSVPFVIRMGDETDIQALAYELQEFWREGVSYMFIFEMKTDDDWTRVGEFWEAMGYEEGDDGDERPMRFVAENAEEPPAPVQMESLTLGSAALTLERVKIALHLEELRAENCPTSR